MPRSLIDRTGSCKSHWLRIVGAGLRLIRSAAHRKAGDRCAFLSLIIGPASAERLDADLCFTEFVAIERAVQVAFMQHVFP